MKWLFGILTLVLAIAAGFWIRGSISFVPKKIVQEQQSAILESIKEVSKLVTVEGQFAEIYDYKDYYTYDWAPFRKKALIRLKANVLAGYDLSNIEITTVPEQKKIIIQNLPKPSVIAVDHDLEYYDLEQGSFNRFKPEDLSAIQEKAKQFIEHQAEESGLLQKAEARGLEILEQLKFLSTDWEIVVKRSPENPLAN